MRILALTLLAAAGCSTTEPDNPLHHGVGVALQGVHDAAAPILAPSTPAGPDGRPILLDLTSAVRRLPSTLRIDTPPFPDHHATVRMAQSPDADWRPRSTLNRALSKIVW